MYKLDKTEGGKADHNKGGGNGSGTQPAPSAPYTKNKKHFLPCNDFQHGSCVAKSIYPSICPSNKDLRRQCNLCLGLRPASECTVGQASKKKYKRGKRN